MRRAQHGLDPAEPCHSIIAEFRWRVLRVELDDPPTDCAWLLCRVSCRWLCRLLGQPVQVVQGEANARAAQQRQPVQAIVQIMERPQQRQQINDHGHGCQEVDFGPLPVDPRVFERRKNDAELSAAAHQQGNR